MSSVVRAATLAQEVTDFLHVISVTGHEGLATQFLRQRLGSIPSTLDALGNLVVELGHGEPRRLIAVPLDEPGYIVSHIQADGYLRLSRVGRPPYGTLWDQAHAGQALAVVTANGPVPGAMAVESLHLTREPLATTPFTVQQAYVDVGAENAAQVRALGIRLLDPVALWRRPLVLHGHQLAAPEARAKAAAIAMLHAVRRLYHSAGAGTIIFAWTTRDRLDHQGLMHIVQQYGAFAEIMLFSEAFGWQQQQGLWSPQALPTSGSGVLAAAAATALPQTTSVPHQPLVPGPFTDAPGWQTTNLGYLGLAARYPQTPVELIAMDDVALLVDIFVAASGRQPHASVQAPPMVTSPLPAPVTNHADTLPVLLDLLTRYGVSGAEAPVRQRLLELLPTWTQPHTDTKGNLLVTFGHGTEHLVFVAHMDEVGFQVTRILDDGRLLVRPLGGLYPSLWEAQAALVHTATAAVPAVFEPRRDWHRAQHRELDPNLQVFVGTTSRQATAALGIHPGQTLTMPKTPLRLGSHRLLARSLDDRAGCTALVLALQRLQRTALTKRLTFAWTVQEEIGLHGARHLASILTDTTRVYPVDTFVSSDAPLASPRFAWTPLGQGAVLRAADSGNIVPRHVINELQALALAQNIPLQYGMTGGWSDGTPFLTHGVINSPLSWPGRYSHSPVEVADLRDIEALVRLIVAIAQGS